MSVVVHSADLNIFDGGFLNHSESWTYSPLMGGSWAVGEQGNIVANFGKGWQLYASTSSSSSLRPDYPIYSSDTLLNGGFWAVGSWGTVARNSGGTWTKWWASSKSGTASSANISADHVFYNPPSVPVLGGAFMVSDRGVVLRDNGFGWELFSSLPTSGNITDILFDTLKNELLLTSNDGKVHSLNASNMQWTSYQTPVSTPIRAITTVGNDVWCVGDFNVILRRPAGSNIWTVMDSKLQGLSLNFTDISPVNISRLWVSTTSGVLVDLRLLSNASVSASIPVQFDSFLPLPSIHIISTSFGITSLGNSIYHWNGRVWTCTYNASSTINAISIVSTTSAWAVGNNGTALRWNGTAWLVTNRITDRNLTEVSALGSGVLASGGSLSLNNDYTGLWKLKTVPTTYVSSNWVGLVNRDLCLFSSRKLSQIFLRSFHFLYKCFRITGETDHSNFTVVEVLAEIFPNSNSLLSKFVPIQLG